MLKLLLPALVPSWRFFDTITESPRIEYALLKSAQDVPTDWQEFRPRPQSFSIITMLTRMLWNPHWNESLFLVSCAERFTNAPTEHSHREIARRIAREAGKGSPYLQFRIAFVGREGTELQKHITYISPVYANEP